MPSFVIKKIRIHGHVQGVYYRAWACDSATKLGLHGWVRNRNDGTVEALFSGEEEKVNTMIKSCYSGPPAAKVSKIEETITEEKPEAGFRQLPTL